VEQSPRTCYRHPDRRAGVICQRCDRPICPDCMHQASVGFHCPECTKTGRQRVVGPSQLGAGLLVTKVLIGCNLAVFLAGVGSGLSTKGSFIEHGGLIANASDRGNLVGVANGEWWRIFSSGFLHANLLHIGFNMWALWVLGQLMEPVLGRARFAMVYGVALVAGALGVLLVDPNQLTVGASGAVFGLMGAAAAAMRSRGINVFATGLGATIMLNLLITFAIPGISIGGHVGGLAGGFVVGWIFVDTPPAWQRNPQLQMAAAAGLAAVLFGACLLVA
jgi:membrane associated rhomboid family serine protease